MSNSSPSIVFEFARTTTPDDHYAFRFEPQEYTVRTAHGGRKSVHMPWSDALLAELESLSGTHCDPTIIEAIGRTLRAFLEPAGWTWHAQSIARAAQESRQIHMTVRSAAAELYALPWELLALDGTGQFVGELPGVLIRYEWPETHTVPAVSVNSAAYEGRLLVAWSETGGAVPEGQHIEAIVRASRASGFGFDRERDTVPHASVGALADTLERSEAMGRPVSVLHLLCHGGKAGKSNGVMLNDERDRNRAVAVDPLRLRQILAPHAGTLRLVVLMVCNGGDSATFNSIAQSLHRAGIQAVVGSRFLLSVSGSVCVAETLYQAMLVKNMSLEDAFLHTRKQLARDASYLDWASLQLYARAADGAETRPLTLSSDTPAASTANAQAKDPEMLTEDDVARLDLPSLIAVRDMAANAIGARFGKNVAAACVELVDGTCDGGLDSALLAQCRNLLATHVAPRGGTVFEPDTSRFYITFAEVRAAFQAVEDFCQAVTEENYRESRDNQITVRVGLHRGIVYTDGKVITGATVDLIRCIAAGARNGEILLSEPALRAAPKFTQAMCSAIEELESIEDMPAVPVYAFLWRDNSQLPASVLFEHSDEEVELPEKDLISFGRLASLPDGTRANDIVLSHPDETIQRAISRWHFELRRKQSGYVLRSTSRLGTLVGDTPVANEQEVPVSVGTVICVAKQLRLVLKGDDGSWSRRHGATMTVGIPM
ncbi:MAG: CHAT domain-containing protein [Proteobacteria bacterium]|nr:CHAT domain-containing protein [Pseudomonadota bacterium]